jgi:predicted nucleic acid-binding protein
MRVGFDTNFLVYLAGAVQSPSDCEKTAKARALYRQLPDTILTIVPIQVLGEFARVLMRVGYSRSGMRDEIGYWQQQFYTPTMDEQLFAAALDLVVEHQLQIWDAFILASVAENGCDVLLSEDMQHGFVWRGVTVVNPFATPTHPKLARLLA